jgi:hypothetical protein
MTTATWQNKSLTKTGNKYNTSKLTANRPKGISDADWNAEVAEFKMNKLIILDQVPKASKKEFVPKKGDE